MTIGVNGTLTRNGHKCKHATIHSPKSDSIKFDALQNISRTKTFLGSSWNFWNIFNLNFYHASVRSIPMNTRGIKISSSHPSFQWKASLTLSSVANFQATHKHHQLNNLSNPLLALNETGTNISGGIYDRYFTVTELQVIFHNYIN